MNSVCSKMWWFVKPTHNHIPSSSPYTLQFFKVQVNFQTETQNIEMFLNYLRNLKLIKVQKWNMIHFSVAICTVNCIAPRSNPEISNAFCGKILDKIHEFECGWVWFGVCKLASLQWNERFFFVRILFRSIRSSLRGVPDKRLSSKRSDGKREGTDE